MLGLKPKVNSLFSLGGLGLENPLILPLLDGPFLLSATMCSEFPCNGELSLTCTLRGGLLTFFWNCRGIACELFLQRPKSREEFSGHTVAGIRLEKRLNKLLSSNNQRLSLHFPVLCFNVENLTDSSFHLRFPIGCKLLNEKKFPSERFDF